MQSKQMFSILQKSENPYRNQNLKVMPPLPPDIRVLDLSGNLFAIIPYQVFTLNLQKLIFKDNVLTQVSSDIEQLQSLDHLDLSYNNIKRIPTNVSRLQHLKYLNLNSNCIEQLDPELFDLQLTFLGIAKNCFTIIPRQISKMIKMLEQFELDWFNYCNLSYFLDEQFKCRLQIIFVKDCSFFDFFYFFMKQPFESNFEKILTNHSLGLLSLHFKQSKQISMKNLVFAVSQQATKENMKCMYYLIELLADFDMELLNIIYIIAARTNQAFILDRLLNYQINMHYQIKFDLICNHKILIIKGQTPYTTLLQHNKNLVAVLDAWVEKGFKPNAKRQGENCLHIAVKHSYQEGVKWALKYCNPDKQESLHKNTPMHILFQKQQSIEIFYLLENSRVNPFLINIHNKIPRFYQTQMVQLRFVKLYLKYEKWFMKYHFQNYNSNKLHEVIQSGSRSNHRTDYESSGLCSATTTQLSAAQSAEQILSEISKILRSTKSITSIFDKLNIQLTSIVDFQGKFLIQLFIYLLIVKIKHGWKFQYQFIPQIISQINLLSALHLPQQKVTLDDSGTLIKQQKILVQQQYQILAQKNTEQDHLSNLSMKLKQNLTNIMDNLLQQKLYENNIILYHQIAYFGDKIMPQVKQNSDNFNILNQYEAIHTCHRYRNTKIVTHKFDEYTNIPESPLQTLNDRMKQAQIVHAKFKDFQCSNKYRSKSQLEM